MSDKIHNSLLSYEIVHLKIVVEYQACLRDFGKSEQQIQILRQVAYSWIPDV